VVQFLLLFYMQLSSKKYAFILPRFGPDIAGGEATLVRQLAMQLAQRGDEITILTTTARDNRTWDPYYPAGVAIDQQMTVRRFPVSPRNLDIWIPTQIRIAEGQRPSIDEQLDWMQHSVNSHELYQYLATKMHEFDAVFLTPYLFGISFWGALIAKEKAFLIPCLHDESYAYLDIMHVMFQSVGGALFNALPEMDLATRLYGKIAGGVVGMGFVPLTPRAMNAISDNVIVEGPYIIYVGRKETGKNVHLLVDYFIEAKRLIPALHDLKLVIVGGGEFENLNRNEALTRGDIIDLKQVSESEKQALIHHSLCLVQPSVNESFSIVLMEAWGLKVPGLVHAQCAVTRHHIEKSGGGLYFSSKEDFAGAVLALKENPTLRTKLAQAGEHYVASEYSWEAVLQRFDLTMQKSIGQERDHDASPFAPSGATWDKPRGS
jgi:glycosyltransferase involved in cell wall biosynthesis